MEKHPGDNLKRKGDVPLDGTRLPPHVPSLLSLFPSATGPGPGARADRPNLITGPRWPPRVPQHPRHDHQSQGNQRSPTHQQFLRSPPPVCRARPLSPQQLRVSERRPVARTSSPTLAGKMHVRARVLLSSRRSLPGEMDETDALRSKRCNDDAVSLAPSTTESIIVEGESARGWGPDSNRSQPPSRTHSSL